MKMNLSDFFLGIFLKNRIFLPRCSAKESCKKWFNCGLSAKSIKLGKKCISVYVITKMNGNHFLPSSMKQVILKQKMKNHFHEFFVVVWSDTHWYRELTILGFIKQLHLYFHKAYGYQLGRVMSYSEGFVSAKSHYCLNTLSHEVTLRWCDIL